MSTDPSVIALGQLFELCKRHPDVVQLLVSNPAALDSLSKYPAQALAALSGLDVVQDLDEPEIPYGLSSLGPADIVARVRNLSALDVQYGLCDTLYAHYVIQRTLSGKLRRPRIVCTEEQSQKTGCATLLFMRGPHQPYMPDRAGALGVLLSVSTRLADWPPFENVFVSQTKDYGERHSHADDWRYAGRYELRESRHLDIDEIAALPEEVFDHWVRNIYRYHSEYHTRMRARIYLSVIDEREDITESDVDRCVAEHGDEIIEKAIRMGDIKDALRDGSVVLRAFAMRPVGYDVGIPLLLEQTRKRLEAEQLEAEDTIEVISGPPRGTKRKTPPTAIELPRPGFGPLTPSLPRMPRPKRSTANAGVDYREYDSECDTEPTRSDGPIGSPCWRTP